MEIAQQIITQRQATDVDAKNHDMSILLGYSIFAILFLIAVYLDSMPPGTGLADFASTIVFP
jgi:hypothetical protein